MTLFKPAYFNFRKELSFESSVKNERRDVHNVRRALPHYSNILDIEKSKKHSRNENASFSVNNKIIVFGMALKSRLSVSH